MKMPVPVLPERVWRTYLGGKRLGERYGDCQAMDGHYPEEWILSTVRAVNPDGSSSGICRAVIEGKEVLFTELHPNMGVLTKVIDSAERLTIQVHPDKAKAMEYFGSPYGKTECWHILGRRGEDTCIYLGFQPWVTKEIWRQCFVSQNIEKMLSCLHRILVKEGETYLIPGGFPHAIGSGCLLLEIQEPTDYTLRVERITPSGERIPDNLIHQGIGVDRMLDCFDYQVWTDSELTERYRLSRKQVWRNRMVWECLAGEPQTDCFTLLYREETDRFAIWGEGKDYGLYIWEGKGRLRCGDREYCLSPGSQFYVPAGCGEFCIMAEERLKLYRIEGGNMEEHIKSGCQPPFFGDGGGG